MISHLLCPLVGGGAGPSPYVAASVYYPFTVGDQWTDTLGGWGAMTRIAGTLPTEAFDFTPHAGVRLDRAGGQNTYRGIGDDNHNFGKAATITAWIRAMDTSENAVGRSLRFAQSNDGAFDAFLFKPYRVTGGTGHLKVTCKVGNGVGALQGFDDADVYAGADVYGWLADGTWIMVAAAIDVIGNTIKTYINGNLVDARAISGVDLTNYNVRAGCAEIYYDAVGGLNRNNGFARLAVFGSILSAGEIASLYAAG